MLRALPALDRRLWKRTSSCLALAWLCSIPSTFAAETVLRLQGSNTIGAKLGPALAKGLFEAGGLHDIRLEPGAMDNEQRVLATTADGREVAISIAAHGSGTGFVALKDGSAELAASSRPIKAAEAEALRGLGDLRSPQAEQIIALDGLAIIVHPSNPLQSLSTAQLAQVFSGAAPTWEALGGKGGPIKLYARDDQSGTYDTFKELVLGAHGAQLSPQAQRFESSERLSDQVSQDPSGIGFIGLPYIRQTKALAVADGESQPMAPSIELIATEDYPLSRRLFLYTAPNNTQPWAKSLLEFAQSSAGQQIVATSGFIAQDVQALKVEPQAQMPPRYRQLAEQAQRLSVNFRFTEGSAQLDNKAMRDVERLLSYLEQSGKGHNQVVLVGFGDDTRDPQRAELLSKLRAMAVRRELVRGGVLVREITGFGDDLPVASNSADDGRIKNRRVEVWVF